MPPRSGYKFKNKVIHKKAYNSLRAQRHRCNNPNASDYKYYGGKGIKVLYTTGVFYKWFDEQHKKFKESDKVCVDRINHDKPYQLNNIQLVLHKDNVIESNIRRGKNGREITRDTTERNCRKLRCWKT